jgi:indoleamine 2,3-dioxygenase
MLLAWLVNFFVHSKPSTKGPIHVPRALAVPLVGVSQILGMAPVLTYADTVLWNWESVNPEKPTKYDNLRITNAFSDTDDERNFYAVSMQVELEGVAILRIIDEYHSLRGPLDQTAIARIGELLTGLAGLIDYLNDIIQSVRERCDHRVFYRDIRPWLEGSDSKTPGYRNWIYEGVKDSNTLDLSGPSGGQSSVLHALDAFLGVDHKNLTGRRARTTENADGGFMERMTRYMPGSHRAYLTRLAAMPRPIRELALRTPTLREPYNLAVTALKDLREKHMRIAFRYIVTMSRALQGKSRCPMGPSVERAAESDGVVLGTGGNDVARLLTACRDATRSTVLV